ncbi:MAG: hypothetical protein QM820_34210 [Minicystis sp.]
MTENAAEVMEKSGAPSTSASCWTTKAFDAFVAQAREIGYSIRTD